MRDASRHLGERVFVYFNLHRRCWSIKLLRTGRVVGHATQVILKDCTFRVSEAGRQRVIREQRKNVHAGVVGTLYSLTSWEHPRVETRRFITYNPYKTDTFMCEGEPIHDADFVSFESRKVRRIA